MNELDINNSVFERIKHIDENGIEYWGARELQIALSCKEWRRFESVIKKATDACKNSNSDILNHFVNVDKMVEINAEAYVYDWFCDETSAQQYSLMMESSFESNKWYFTKIVQHIHYIQAHHQ